MRCPNTRLEWQPSTQDAVEVGCPECGTRWELHRSEDKQGRTVSAWVLCPPRRASVSSFDPFGGQGPF